MSGLGKGDTVWAITDPRGHVVSGIYAHHEDALIDCSIRNETIRTQHAYIHGDYCSIKAFDLIPDSLHA